MEDGFGRHFLILRPLALRDLQRPDRQDLGLSSLGGHQRFDFLYSSHRSLGGIILHVLHRRHGGLADASRGPQQEDLGTALQMVRRHFDERPLLPHRDLPPLDGQVHLGLPMVGRLVGVRDRLRALLHRGGLRSRPFPQIPENLPFVLGGAERPSIGRFGSSRHHLKTLFWQAAPLSNFSPE